MKVLSTLECIANFPDDQIDSDNKIIRPGGLNVAEALGAMLLQKGFEVCAPRLDGEHGWEIIVKEKGREFWILVSDGLDVKIIQFGDTSSLWKKIIEGDKPYIEFILLVALMLEKDSRFGNFNWYPRAGYDAKHTGQKSPIAAKGCQVN